MPDESLDLVVSNETAGGLETRAEGERIVNRGALQLVRNAAAARGSSVCQVPLNRATLDAVPANVSPPYKAAEQRFRAATSHSEKIDALREMIALLPKHKGTEKMHADLKKRLAKLEEESEHARGGGKRADHTHVRREGAGQWVLLGPPNAGKSSLLRALTHAHPEIAPYPFTTLAPQPGMMSFEDVQVQLVDTPAVAAEHTPPYLTNLAREADGVLLVVDVTADDVDASLRGLLELLDRAHVWPAARVLPSDASPLLVCKPVFMLGNKSDQDDADGTFAALAREGAGAFLPFFAVSADRGDGLEALRPILFRELQRIRVYSKAPGHKPDLNKPFVLPAGSSVHDLAGAVHQEIAERLKFARLWGPHARFEGQQVDRHHVLGDRDVVELHA